MFTSVVVFYLVCAIIFNVTNKILFKYVLNEAEPYVFTLLERFVSMLVFLPFLLFSDVALPNSWSVWVLIVIGGVIWTVVALIGNISYKKAQISVREPVTQSRVIWVLFLGILFLGETFSVSKLIGTFVIFFGVFLLAYHPERKFKNLKDEGILFVLFYSMLIGAAVVFDKWIVGTVSLELYGFFTYLVPSVLLAVFLKNKRMHLRNIYHMRKYTALLAIVFSALTYYCVLKVFTLIEASIAYPIVQSSILLVVLGGILFLGERDRLWQKLAASLVVIAGVILLKS